MRFGFLSVVFVAALCILAPASRAEDLYTVSGLHVDASGTSSSEALNSAIAQGRAKAFQILFRRLTRQADWTRQPPQNTAQLTRLSRGYTVTNERRSTTRYVADTSYIFNPDAVARLLRASNIAFSQTSVKRILLIAMAPGVTHGPWAVALNTPQLRDGTVPYMLPAAEDDAAISAINFDTAGWNDIASAAARIHASEAALVQAVYGGGKITVNIRRLGQGQAPAKTSVDVALTGTAGATYPVAAQVAINAMDDLWKSRSAIDYSQRGKLTADLRLSSVNQLGAVQNQLAMVSNVTGVQLVAMNLGYVRLGLSYTGTTEQLREVLSGQGLILSNRGGQWMLSTGATGATGAQ